MSTPQLNTVTTSDFTMPGNSTQTWGFKSGSISSTNWFSLALATSDVDGGWRITNYGRGTGSSPNVWATIENKSDDAVAYRFKGTFDVSGLAGDALEEATVTPFRLDSD